MLQSCRFRYYAIKICTHWLVPAEKCNSATHQSLAPLSSSCTINPENASDYEFSFRKMHIYPMSPKKSLIFFANDSRSSSTRVFIYIFELVRSVQVMALVTRLENIHKFRITKLSEHPSGGYVYPKLYRHDAIQRCMSLLVSSHLFMQKLHSLQCRSHLMDIHVYDSSLYLCDRSWPRTGTVRQAAIGCGTLRHGPEWPRRHLGHNAFHFTGNALNKIDANLPSTRVSMFKFMNEICNFPCGVHDHVLYPTYLWACSNSFSGYPQNAFFNFRILPARDLSTHLQRIALWGTNMLQLAFSSTQTCSRCIVNLLSLEVMSDGHEIITFWFWQIVLQFWKVCLFFNYCYNNEVWMETPKEQFEKPPIWK